MMSLVIQPSPLILSQQFLFSAAVALGILDLVRGFEAKNWSIKWPNDIYWNDRKAAGILIESIVLGKNWHWAVVGIGMNLNQESFPSDIPNAISLKQITGKNYGAVSVARELVPKIKNRIDILRQEPDLILKSFNEFLYKRNQCITLKKGNEVLITDLSAVDTMGYLITNDGMFKVGEIEFVADPRVL